MKNRLDQEHIIIAILVIGIVVIGIASVLPEERNTITVSGSAEMDVEPTEARIYLGADIFAETASEAQNQNSAIINSIIDALKGEGIPESDIETYSFSVYPRYSYVRDEEPVITGYTASHILKITTSDTDKAGDLIDASFGAGANKVERVEFTLDKDEEREVKRELVSTASLDARNKAEGLASALGVMIKRVKSVSESVSFMPYRVYAEAIPISAGAKATVVPPSQVEVSGSVSVVYEIW